MGTHPIFESDFDCLTVVGSFLVDQSCPRTRGKTSTPLRPTMNSHLAAERRENSPRTSAFTACGRPTTTKSQILETFRADEAAKKTIPRQFHLCLVERNRVPRSRRLNRKTAQMKKWRRSTQTTTITKRNISNRRKK